MFHSYVSHYQRVTKCYSSLWHNTARHIWHQSLQPELLTFMVVGLGWGWGQRADMLKPYWPQSHQNCKQGQSAHPVNLIQMRPVPLKTAPNIQNRKALQVLNKAQPFGTTTWKCDSKHPLRVASWELFCSHEGETNLPNYFKTVQKCTSSLRFVQKCALTRSWKMLNLDRIPSAACALGVKLKHLLGVVSSPQTSTVALVTRSYTACKQI